MPSNTVYVLVCLVMCQSVNLLLRSSSVLSLCCRSCFLLGVSLFYNCLSIHHITYLVRVLDMSLDAKLDYGPRNWVTLTIKQSKLVHRTNLFFLTILICGIAPVHNCVFRAYNGKKTLSWARL